MEYNFLSIIDRDYSELFSLINKWLERF
jgi:hypothetical protein